MVIGCNKSPPTAAWLAEEGFISPVDPELRFDFIWQQAPWPLYGFIPWLDPIAQSLLTLLAFPLWSSKRKWKTAIPGHHIGHTVGHFFFLPELSNHNTSHFIHKGANTSPQHFSNLLLLEGKYTKTLAVHLSKPGTNGLLLMASKVNREVCQLKVNGCLLNTSVCFHFTRKRRKGKWQPRRCFILFCSLGGSRGQDLIGLLSYQSVFDKSWMEPVLFVFCSGWDSCPFVWHVSVEWTQLVFV